MDGATGAADTWVRCRCGPGCDCKERCEHQVGRGQKPLCRSQHQGSDPVTYSRFARIAACRVDARAEIAITALMVMLSRFGSVMVGCGGQLPAPAGPLCLGASVHAFREY
jgi:hypothetical protein